MPPTADPIAAVVEFLKADAAIAALVAGRVFGAGLPRGENVSMPRAAIVVKPSGGGALGGGYQKVGDKRVDVDCYAATDKASYELFLAVHGALKRLRREVHAGVLLHWGRIVADGATGREPDTDWPLTISSWQVLASEVKAA